MQGKNGKDFVAVDEFEFLQSEICELSPPEAKPIVPTTQPPIPPTTTPEPTEPPGRKFLGCAILYCSLYQPLISL